ncbi:MAG: hypothetical protein IT445_03890 [Phycisphaeraceae bacterium]|nr:hypothetical protein [Phycisphaeraceae bacterium]
MSKVEIQLMRALLTVGAMLTIAPLTAVTTLVCCDPERWGGSIDPLSIVVMSIFGLITVPLWPTYIPAIVIIPVAMHSIVALPLFKKLFLPYLVCIFFAVGAIVGIAFISTIVPWHDSLDLIFNWLSAGAMSGGITLSLIVLVYRHEPKTARPVAAHDHQRP